MHFNINFRIFNEFFIYDTVDSAYTEELTLRHETHDIFSEQATEKTLFFLLPNN